MVESDPDFRLMRAVAEGDERALAEIVDRWQKPVLAFICRFVGCGDDEAKDLAQEAFLRVWANSGRWRPTARFSTWLFTIVANLCRNQLRTVSRRPRLVTIDGHDAQSAVSRRAAGPERDPHALAEARETGRSLRRALDQLPENQRAALLLKQVEGLKYREIAGVLGVSESAVESLLVRARRAMLRHMSG